MPTSNGETEKKPKKENTPTDRIVELCRSLCVDGWNAHFPSLGIVISLAGFFTSMIRCVAMQKDSRRPTLVQLIIHCGMGAELGALLALAMLLTDQRIFQSMASSSSPLMDMAMFIGLFSFVIGIGATMSGFIFTAIELNSLEAKKQTKRINQRRD